MSNVTREQMFQAAKELDDLTRKTRQLRADLKAQGINILPEPMGFEEAAEQAAEACREWSERTTAQQARDLEEKRKKAMEDANMDTETKGAMATAGSDNKTQWYDLGPGMTSAVAPRGDRTTEDYLNELREVVGMTRSAVEELRSRLEPVLYNRPEIATASGGSMKCEAGFYLGNELAGAIDALMDIQSRVRMITSDLAL